jgi:DNA-binding response OmpR family regulator
MSRKILLVDDDKETVNFMKYTMKLKGYEIFTASSGREALEQIAFNRPDAVVLDVMMPVLDGFTTLKAIRANPATAELPVLMLTAITEEASVTRAWREGANLYLAKPFEVEELSACIEAIFEGHELLPTQPSKRTT